MHVSLQKDKFVFLLNLKVFISLSLNFKGYQSVKEFKITICYTIYITKIPL